MSYRTDDMLAHFASLSKNCATRRIAIKIAAAGNITPTQLTPGHYMCRLAGGGADKTITGKLLTAGTAVADTTLALPAAGAAEVAGLFSAPADTWFPLAVDTAAPYLAPLWDGAADDVLILTRVGP